MKLYVYDHCPYCVKARMIFALTQTPYALITLLNDDEETPIRMVGKKVVPILEKEDGSFMPESMDIVHYVDGLGATSVLRTEEHTTLALWCNQARNYLYALAMPRWVRAPLAEFATQSARAYFIKKKEAMIGSFDDALRQSDAWIDQANSHLHLLDGLLETDRLDAGVSEYDIHLFAVLRGLSIVRGIVYPPQVDAYRTHMAHRTQIPLHDAYAS
jgi:glutaredoxin 2